jgi:hypothetical protein
VCVGSQRPEDGLFSSETCRLVKIDIETCSRRLCGYMLSQYVVLRGRLTVPNCILQHDTSI